MSKQFVFFCFVLKRVKLDGHAQMVYLGVNLVSASFQLERQSDRLWWHYKNVRFSSSTDCFVCCKSKYPRSFKFNFVGFLMAEAAEQSQTELSLQILWFKACSGK